MSKLLMNRIALWGRIYVLCALIFGSGSALAQASNAVESIATSVQPGGKLMLKVTLKEALSSPPPNFAVTNPARIVVDIPNASNATGRSAIDIAESDVRSISIVEAPGRTRLVVNLSRAIGYTTSLDGKSFLLSLDSGSAGTNVINPAQISRFAEALPGAVKSSVQNIDFRRGAQGEARIEIDLPNAQTGIDIRSQGKSVIVELQNTTAPKNLLKRFDVGDFGTPVRSFDVVEQGNSVRVLVEPRGLWEHNAYQTDTKFVLEIRQLKEDPNRLVQSSQPGYAGEKLSLSFQNIEVRSLLQVIAEFTGLNIITSDTVGGSLTLRLKDVPWDQALDIVLQTKGLAKRKNGNVVLIAPSDELAAKEKLQLEASQQIADLEPLRTENFSVSFAKAEDVKKILSDPAQKILSKRGSAVIDSRTNTIFVQDIASRLDEARKMIQQLDVPVRQVQIEARIVIADDKFSRQLGARFGVQSAITAGRVNIGQSGSLTNTVSPLGNNVLSPGSSGLALANTNNTPAGAQPEQLNINLPVAGAAGQLALTALNLGSGNLLNIELSALEADNRGKVVSNPRVVTADKQKAEIVQGTEIPYFTAAASGATTVQFKRAVLGLTVTPRITPDDNVIMELEVKKDSVGQIFGGVPSIDTKNVTTQVLAGNGDTVVLGGIYEQETRNDVIKVPLLGDLPFIGNAFKRTVRTDNKTELLIFITPKIIKDSLNIR